MTDWWNDLGRLAARLYRSLTISVVRILNHGFAIWPEVKLSFTDPL
jgi:hypothetical protein